MPSPPNDQMHDDPHTDFEQAIERHLHGALGEAEAKALAEHLARCESCRAYERSTSEMETNMEMTSELFMKGVAWGRLQGAVTSRTEELRATARVAPVLVVALGALLFALSPHAFTARTFLWLGAALLATVTVPWLRLRDLERRTLAAGTATGALFDVVRADNRRQRLRLVLSMMLAAAVAAHLGWDFRASREPADLVGVGLIAFALVEGGRRLLRLRREHQDLARA